MEKKGELVRFKMELVKETEIPALYLLQHRGLPQAEWKHFLFENVVDAKGRRYHNHKILLSGRAPNREIQALGLMCQPGEINEKMEHAIAHPIEPEIVDSGPVHEVVSSGDELDSYGLDQLAYPLRASRI